VSSRLVVCGLALVFSVAGCSSPPSAPSVSAAPTASATTVTSAGPVGSDSALARTCSVSGFRWRREVTINPTMAVSNDGYCNADMHLVSNSGVIIQVETPPQHGHITISGNESSRAQLRYIPDKDYIGSDSFIVTTGNGKHSVTADFAVTVTG
jgi:Bacterial Ig domain